MPGQGLGDGLLRGEPEAGQDHVEPVAGFLADPARTAKRVRVHVAMIQQRRFQCLVRAKRLILRNIGHVQCLVALGRLIYRRTLRKC